MIRRGRRGQRRGIRTVVRCTFGVVALVAAAPFVVPSGASAQAPSLHFERLGAREGLSQASVMAIAQDSLGFMWVGTQDGLNRWDGYDFQVHRSRPDDAGALRNAYVNALATAPDGTLWVATFGGLHRYDAASGRLEAYVPRDGDATSLPGRIVRDLHVAPDGSVWVATTAGVAHLDPTTGHFRRYPVPASDGGPDVRTLTVDRDGVVWVGTPGGLRTLDPASGAWAAFEATDGTRRSPTARSCGARSPGGTGRCGSAPAAPDWWRSILGPGRPVSTAPLPATLRRCRATTCGPCSRTGAEPCGWARCPGSGRWTGSRVGSTRTATIPSIRGV